ncbi:lactase/phlorizin hydrolase-like [Acanthochromis polyacanthus]|uniref:lactase/phlorizin hydrolase-like n=1 Tax=Acanthochromis polyacanthus TaxID=80966 RepID=UPI0022342F91|nr:lactase/phlorizin hydrolase-like [Acanthochromis polyacanthus]
MIDIFNDYCDFCFVTFGDRVKLWMTINQPHSRTAPYIVAHNLIKAHAKAYHTYDDKYRASQGGLVSIALNADWIEPKDANVLRDVESADRALQFQLGWFAHPIFKNGDYPDAMKWQISAISELQDLSESRLPSFTEEEKNYIKGTADMFCINHYTTKVVTFATGHLTNQSYEQDRDVLETEEPTSPETPYDQQRAVAWGLRRLLNWIKEEYGNPQIYVTENGWQKELQIAMAHGSGVELGWGAEGVDHGCFFNDAFLSFQIEGGWRADGKGFNIWDEFSHTPGRVANHDNGDVACNSYNKLDEDIEVLKKLKVTHYRFSVSWPRVLPDGTNNNINDDGLNYYHRLLDALEAANIQPQLTLYHWDLPLALQRIGGWENDIIVQRFREYADVLFSRLGSKVKIWITLNEPWIVALLGYGYGNFAPGLPSQPQQAVVNCYQTLMKQLHQVGLEPLVILHGSTVPDSLRSRENVETHP